MRNSVCKRLRQEALDDMGGSMVAVYDGEERAPVYHPFSVGGMVDWRKVSKGVPRYMEKCARSVYKDLKRIHHEMS